MLNRSISIRPDIGVFLGVLMFAFLLAMNVQCTQGPSETTGSGTLELGGVPSYEGENSLEERILKVDVVAKVRLSSVSAGTEHYAVFVGQPPVHVGTLEHNFEVLEYLKGTGDDQIVAIVWEIPDLLTQSEKDAALQGNALLQARDTQWDNRDAIVFLYDLLAEPNWYVLGAIEDHPFFDPTFDDGYSIASAHSKNWLPSTVRNTGAKGAPLHRSTGSDSQAFYLGPPVNGASRQGRSSGQSVQSTITLASLKSKIAALNQEITAGDGTDEYRDCVAMKYSAARLWDYQTDGGAQPHYWRYDETIGSGLAAGTFAYATLNVPPSVRQPVAPGPRSPDYQLLDNDAALFSVSHPGLVFTARPLPVGEYRFYLNRRARGFVICDGQPAGEERDVEVFITVTAPEGVVHEAFFDPVSRGDAMGYFGTGDALKPATFRTSDVSITITSLYTTGDTVTMALSPYNALAGKTLDFITGDGSTSLSLEASAATGDSTAGTLTWAVGSQPWSSGDELMLRIR